MSYPELTKEELKKRAQAYIEGKKAKDEEPTKEGWLKMLKDDFVGGWEEMVDTLNETWETMSKTTDAFFGQDKEKK